MTPHTPPAIFAPAPGRCDRARFVRATLRVDVYGIAGSGVLVLDRCRGRYALRLAAGPVSQGEGWDGRTAWRSDASGSGRIQGNVDQRGQEIDFARMLLVGGSEHATMRPRTAVVDPRSGLLASVVQRVGERTITTRFDDYRSANGVIAPFSFVRSDESGPVRATVTAVVTSASVASTAFSVPAVAHDATIAGHTTTVPIEPNTLAPLLDVRVNGKRFRFLLDSGGANVISPEAARRAGLAIVGSARIGGAGPDMVPVRYAWARDVTIGKLRMNKQAFTVLSIGGRQFDGLVGYELLQRFATRIDYKRARITFTDRKPTVSRGGIVVPMRFRDTIPEVDGSIDGLRGPFSLDTGNATRRVDVQSPAVRANNLVTRYHARVGGLASAGVGGPVREWLVRAREIRIGGFVVQRPELGLTDASSGYESDPSILANAGYGVLARRTVLFDYPRARIAFEPGGIADAGEARDRAGLKVLAQSGVIRIFDVLTATPGAEGGVKAGDVIVSADGRAVNSAMVRNFLLRLTRPGPLVLVVRRNHRTMTLHLRLRRYV